jgi:transcriptional regulator
MYVPASFRETEPGALFGLIRSCPLGTLVTAGPNGLEASPVPFLAYPDEGQQGVLRAHLARANPHWRQLDGVTDCLIIFNGADAYVTPSWYPSKAQTHKAVPTWNYASVHVRGKPTVMDDADWLLRQITHLTSTHEERRSAPWAVSDAPADYLAAQMKAIVGIEIAITQIEGKWKMSQNKDAADRGGIVAGMGNSADPHYNSSVAAEVADRGAEIG